MFSSEQEQFEKLQKAVKNYWPNISDEEYLLTQGDLQSVLSLVSDRNHVAPEVVLQKLREFIKRDEKLS